MAQRDFSPQNRNPVAVSESANTARVAVPTPGAAPTAVAFVPRHSGTHRLSYDGVPQFANSGMVAPPQ